MAQDIEALRKRLIGRAKKQVQVKYAETDVHIIRAVSVLNDLDNAFNLLAEDCVEWYSSHFPELYSIVRDNEAFLKIVSGIGERKGISEKALAKALGESAKAKDVEAKARASMGSDIPQQALKEIMGLAENALGLKGKRKEMQAFIEKEMEKLVSNFSRAAGPVLGARLLAQANGLKQLALMPSSTLQLLGAEKALFRHLKNKKSKGPKYGFIYGHPLVRNALAKHKGKLARSLAGKLVLCARADFFGEKKDIATAMMAALEEKAKRLK